jgi:carboxymethylenebutenolidase
MVDLSCVVDDGSPGGARMNERFVQIETPSGRMETFLTHPEQDGPFPAVLVYMDIWGVREELFEIARRVATVGYYCLVPDFYYRQGTVRHEFRDAQNRMISLHALDEARRQRVIAPGRLLSNAMVVDDTGAILEFLRRGEPVKPGGVGAIGYCMGGRRRACMARRSSATHPTPRTAWRGAFAASSIAGSRKPIPTRRCRW